MTTMSGVNNDNEVFCFDAGSAKGEMNSPKQIQIYNMCRLYSFIPKSRCKCSGNL